MFLKKACIGSLLLSFAIYSFAMAPWAVVLSGGGARGAYEAGALMAIKELNLNVQGVYGTSVGALNGAFFVQGISDKLYDMWQDLSFYNVVKLPGSFQTDTLYKFFSELSQGGLNVSPLKSLISSYLNEKKIRKSGIDFGLVTFDLSTFSPVEFYISQIPNGELLDYLMASANYPIFRRWKIGKNVYIDGGIYNNAPVSMALKKGFKKILLINASDIPIFLPKIPKNVEFLEVTPSGPLGNAMEFVPNEERTWEKMGYLDTLKAFGKLEGNEYYITPSASVFIVDEMLKMNENEIRRLAEFLGVNVKNCTVKFAVYERVIPKLLDMFPAESFKELNLEILESAAVFVGIQRLKIYTQASLFHAVAKAKNPNELEDILNIKGAFAVKFVKEINFLH